MRLSVYWYGTPIITTALHAPAVSSAHAPDRGLSILGWEAPL